MSVSHRRAGVRHFASIGSGDDHSENEEQRRVTWVGLWSNVGLMVSKGVVGTQSGSASLLADAVHSASDFAGDIVTLAAINLSQRPADETHPYGYGHYENLGALAISTLLMAGGAAMGYHSMLNLSGIASANDVAASSLTMIPAALAVIGASVAVKEALYRYTIEVGKRTRSPVLVANAWHHRTDAFSSIVALVGVAGAHEKIGMPYLDPVAGILVSGMVMKAGAEMGWEAVGKLTDRRTDSDTEIIQEIYTLARAMSLRPGSGIIDAHEVRIRTLGHYDLVDLHLRVDPRLSVTGGYIEKTNIKSAILERFPSIQEVFVHVQAHSSRQTFTSSNFDATVLPMNVKRNSGGAIVTKERAPSSPARTQFQIEADVKRAVAVAMRIEPHVEGVSHTIVHYDYDAAEEENARQPIVKVEANLVMNKDITIRQAEEAAHAVRASILDIDDVQAVDLHIELPDP